MEVFSTCLQREDRYRRFIAKGGRVEGCSSERETLTWGFGVIPNFFALQEETITDGLELTITADTAQKKTDQRTQKPRVTQLTDYFYAPA